MTLLKQKGSLGKKSRQSCSEEAELLRTPYHPSSFCSKDGEVRGLATLQPRTEDSKRPELAHLAFRSCGAQSSNVLGLV